MKCNIIKVTHSILFYKTQYPGQYSESNQDYKA